jgi:integrase
MPKRGKQANGEGTITQREDGRWMGQISLGFDPQTGKRVRKTVYGDTQGEVRGKLEELKADRDGQAVESQIPLNRFLDLWLSSVKDSVAESSLTRYGTDLAHLREHLGKVPVAQLTARHVIQLYRLMEEGGATPAARHMAGVRLRQSLAMGVRLGYVRKNVARDIPLPKVSREEIRPLTPAEVQLFLETGRRTRWHALYVVALDSGARRGELLTLEWSDWNPATRELSVTKTLVADKQGKLRVKEPKTRASRRKIVLSPEGAAAMEWQRSYQRAEGLVTRIIFANQKGKWMHAAGLLRDSFWPLCELAGLDIRFHDLRHTTATLLLTAGVDPRTVSERLGHANTKKLFDTYAHVIPSSRQRAASLMGGFLSGSKLAVNEEPAVTEPPGETRLTR